MIGNKLYAGLALKDVFRLWSATQLQVVIISGICLPILILLGLKNGHVADLREELASSPTGRQVIFWSAQGGELLSDNVMETILDSVPNAELIIPESQRLVFAAGDQSQNLPITLYSTLPGDPLLVQFGIASIDPEEREVVLSSSIATALGVEVGDSLPIEISRQLGSDRESHRIECRLSGVLPDGTESSVGGAGYAHLEMMKKLERYGSGASVEEWAIPAMKERTAIDLYETMLLICFRSHSGDLTSSDHKFLESRGLSATPIEDPLVRSLYGTLDDSVNEKLVAYRLERLDKDNAGLQPIRDNPQLIVRNTEAEDDMIVRWAEPIEMKLNGQPHLLVGLTLPSKRETGGWLNNFIRPEARRFTYQESIDAPLSVFVSAANEQDGEAEATTTFSLELADHHTTELQDASKTATDGITNEGANKAPNGPVGVIETPADGVVDTASASGIPIAIVPVNLLAYIHQLNEGLVEFDPSGKRFVEMTSELDYTKARLYTRTIDDVPEAVAYLSNQNYAVLSESSRIAEIHQQDHSLQTLVYVVAFGVFAFGIVTVFSVLVDSTDRKKGTIGILRVMGMNRFGVFMVVLFRAFVIGLLAAVLCVVVGFALAWFLKVDASTHSYLASKPVINVVLDPIDLILVAIGALLCASLGAILPALKASKLDPFDAITEGQFG